MGAYRAKTNARDAQRFAASAAAQMKAGNRDIAFVELAQSIGYLSHAVEELAKSVDGIPGSD